jgi:hypothetical protein
VLASRLETPLFKENIAIIPTDRPPTIIGKIEVTISNSTRVNPSSLERDLPVWREVDPRMRPSRPQPALCASRSQRGAISDFLLNNTVSLSKIRQNLRVYSQSRYIKTNCHNFHTYTPFFLSFP